jgi:hypothetical protein
MSSPSTPDRPSRPGGPRRVRLPGFLVEGDIGLGEVIKRATSLAGISPCSSCAERAKRLDGRIVFSKRR